MFNESSSGPDLIPDPGVRVTHREWMDDHRPGWRESPAVVQALETDATSSYYLKTVYWTERIMAGMRSIRDLVALTTPGFRSIGVGYFDPTPAEGDYFGVVINTRMATAGRLNVRCS